RPARPNALPQTRLRQSVAAIAPLPPDASEPSLRMTQLAAREQHLLAQLDAVQQRAAQAASEGSADGVRELELEQELRHVRATETWLEQRFVSESAACQQASVSGSASR
ncbi:MAG TPA: hypothetical protein VGJ91_21640, partial [Polyangiaceae bacterium]